jgi:hypothetical protein
LKSVSKEAPRSADCSAAYFSLIRALLWVLWLKDSEIGILVHLGELPILKGLELRTNQSVGGRRRPPAVPGRLLPNAANWSATKIRSMMITPTYNQRQRRVLTMPRRVLYAICFVFAFVSLLSTLVVGRQRQFSLIDDTWDVKFNTSTPRVAIIGITMN